MRIFGDDVQPDDDDYFPHAQPRRRGDCVWRGVAIDRCSFTDGKCDRCGRAKPPVVGGAQ